ncbi:hypothetical protein ABZ890_43800 [Streptomyces sp. NPDC046984]|uniref:hypothetical protein n=1 Tax=Streptomyces sp. NPDC046984 TaxID=3155138 RepID=UPI00340B1053
MTGAEEESRGNGVAWRESAAVLTGCWAVCGLTYGVLRMLDTPTVPIAAPVVILLVQWCVARHRHWTAAVAAFCLGSFSVFLLVDTLRQQLARLDADALATAAGAFVALVVFTGASRITFGRPA